MSARKASGWDAYFTPSFCGGTTQPGYVIYWRGRWWRTPHRVDPSNRAEFLRKEDADKIKARLPRLSQGNALFGAYLHRTGRAWSDVPLFPLADLGEDV